MLPENVYYIWRLSPIGTYLTPRDLPLERLQVILSRVSSAVRGPHSPSRAIVGSLWGSQGLT